MMMMMMMMMMMIDDTHFPPCPIFLVRQYSNMPFN
jgi:hypothetical protein